VVVLAQVVEDKVLTTAMEHKEMVLEEVQQTIGLMHFLLEATVEVV
jgi:hypothetical protein